MFKRIVSLAPSFSETIFALDQQEKLIGVTNHCNYPPECLDLPKIGGFANPDVDKIIALKPDLVLVTTLHNLEKLKPVSDSGIKIVQIEAKKIFDAPDVLRKIGSLVDAE